MKFKVVRLRKPRPAQKYGLDQRLTPKIAGSGWTGVPDVLIRGTKQFGITAQECMLLVAVLSVKWTDAMPAVTLKRLAGWLGVSPVSVRTWVRNLENRGLIKRLKRPGSANTFDLQPLFEKLEERIDEQRRERQARIALQVARGLPEESV